jgi:hypothetical protein
MSYQDDDEAIDREAADAAESAGSVDEEDAVSVSDRCDSDRESMTPRETADCAGSDLAKEYDNEEDGGS